MTFAAGAVERTRFDDDMRLFEYAHRQILRIESGAGDIGKGIDRPLRLHTGHAWHLIQRLDHNVALAPIGLDDCLHTILRPVDSGTRALLNECPFIERYVSIEHHKAWCEKVRSIVTDPRLELYEVEPD